jgi:hypothetical protein
MLGNRVKAEVLSESPSAMAGVHIAEALSRVVPVAFVLLTDSL